jgi:hypothetical protein
MLTTRAVSGELNTLGMPNRLYLWLRVALIDPEECTGDETLRTVRRPSQRRPMRQRSA